MDKKDFNKKSEGPLSLSAADYVPASHTTSKAKRMDELRDAAKGCRGCELYKDANQTVFGRGPARAKIFMIGEQPGDKEDIVGSPFVGPSGKLLEKICRVAGISLSDVYLTNAVKHFRWRPSGKRRIHEKPGIRHVDSCHAWLIEEITAINPRVVVCLGATSVYSIFGKMIKISAARNRIISSVLGIPVWILPHPSSLLRIPDMGAREMAIKEYVSSFRKLKELMEGPSRPSAEYVP